MAGAIARVVLIAGLVVGVPVMCSSCSSPQATVVASTGAGPELVTVQSVYGKFLEFAAQTIVQQHLRYVVTYHPPRPSESAIFCGGPPVVDGQSPGAGARVLRGTLVTLSVCQTSE